jgi:ketosteroid isomerase-like protein
MCAQQAGSRVGSRAAGGSTTDDEAQVRAVLERRAAGLRRKDAAAFVAPYAAEAVRFDLAPPLRLSGPEAIAERGMQDWFATFLGPIGYDVTELSITTGDKAAFCHSLNRLSGSRTDGDEDMWFRQSVGLRKIDGTWKITHEHNSVPFYMDEAGRAATDLRP